MEQYTGPNYTPSFVASKLDAEHLKSSELAYIYHHAGIRFRSTLFYTRVEDLIEFYQHPGDPNTWRNHGDIDTTGLELEWHQNLSRAWEWFANLSYVDTKDKLAPENDFVGAVNWLGNLGATWRHSDNYRHSLLVHYVGEQKGWPVLPGHQGTDRYDDYATLDYTLTIHRFLNVDSLDVSASINNLTDKHYNTLPVPNQFPSGLSRGERTAWVQLSYGF